MAAALQMSCVMWPCEVFLSHTCLTHGVRREHQHKGNVQGSRALRQACAFAKHA